MRKQAELYLIDLYYNPNSSYYDQGNRIRNYQPRILPRLRESGYVYHSGELKKGRGHPIALWSLTGAGHSLVKKLLHQDVSVIEPVSYWSRLKRMLNR